MTASWFPIHQHSMFSLLDGLSKPHQMAERLVECGHAGGAVTDHGTVAGCISFVKAVQDACGCGHPKKSHSENKGRCLKDGCGCGGFDKAGLKPVLGCEFYLSKDDAARREKDNRALSHLCVLAKSLQGWKALVRASSASNRPEHFYYRPRLDLEKLAAFAGGHLVAFSGHPGSDLANVVFGENFRRAYRAATYEEARGLVRDDWKTAVVNSACNYRDLFGRDNFFLEVQTIDAHNLPAAEVVARTLRWVSKKTGIPCVATADSHYPRPEDAADQRVLLCAALQTTMRDVERRLAADEDVTLGGFFRSNRYHIPTLAEMEALHTPDELANSLRIAEMCESYDVLGRPMLPVFPSPAGLSGEDHMRQLCEEGWQRKVEPRLRDGLVFCPGTGESHPQGAYRERLQRELGVIFEAGLAGYFLVVQDYVAWAKERGKVGKGRGSGAGCLASYLMGITDVDPIEYKLLFERFYNSGRNAPGRVALPDIDTDFEKFRREDVIAYVRAKYGPSRVAQMTTFGRMQGRSALSDVLRAHGDVSFEEAKKVTAHVPDEAAIADHLQEMLEERGESSIIRWALENEAEALAPWCRAGAGGRLEGPLAPRFEQAIRLEGTLRSQGKHPSGVIISAEDLADVVPMVHDRSSGEMVVGLEMRDAEAVGLTKFDLLGTAVLDKIRGAVEVARTGRLTRRA